MIKLFQEGLWLSKHRNDCEFESTRYFFNHKRKTRIVVRIEKMKKIKEDKAKITEEGKVRLSMMFETQNV